MFKFYNLLLEKTFTLNKLSFFLTVFISLFTLHSSTTIKAETINNHQIHMAFYGNTPKPNTIGAEYLIFEDYNNSVRGLIYVQNADVFACFQGDFDRQNQSLKNIIFAYPDMENNEWIKNQSEEQISLQNFPHQLNDIDVNEHSKQLFDQCLNYFEGS